MILYFAYGSNLSRKRIVGRCPQAQFYGNAFLLDWEILFSKMKSDGTGAANIREKTGSKIWGVVFTLSPECLKSLDLVEGHKPGEVSKSDYDRRKLRVQLETGAQVEAWAYIAETADEHIAPTEEYLNHILSGALEHGLPEEHIALIKSRAKRS